MPQTLDSQGFTVAVQATVNNPLDLQTATSVLTKSYSYGMSSGTGAGQADRLFSDTRTIAPSTSDDIDLAGVLFDPVGTLLTFARIKGFVIAANAANTNNLVVGNAAANGFVTWVGGATHTVTVAPGGLLAVFRTDATAYAVTAGTGDLLRVTNGGAGTSVTYDVILIGSSV